MVRLSTGQRVFRFISIKYPVVGGILFRDAQTEGPNSNNDGCASRGVGDVVNYGS